MILCSLLGAARLLSVQPDFDRDPSHVAYYNDAEGAPVTLVGMVMDNPDIRDTYTNLRIKANRLFINEEAIAGHGFVLVRAPRYPPYMQSPHCLARKANQDNPCDHYHYGDVLTITAHLEEPPEFEGFSYKDYLAQQYIYAMMRRPRIEIKDTEQGFWLFTWIYRFKAQAHDSINHILPEPHAALLNGILLGIETGIPRDLYDLFNATGASHIIVISGSNISLLIKIFLILGQPLFGRLRSAIVAIGGIALYTLLVGADTAVVRAALMGSICALALFMGRQNDVLNTLFATGFLMTLYDPLDLWDIGFQLSFVATLGLIVLVPPLAWSLSKMLTWFSVEGKSGIIVGMLNEAILVTIAAQIATTPLLIYHFSRFSVVSLLTNFLIVPVQLAVMVVGGVATLGGMIFMPMGQALAWLAWLPLAWTITIVRWTADFSWAQLVVPETPLWLVGLAYLTLAAGTWWIYALLEQYPTQISQLKIRHTWSLRITACSFILGILGWSATHNTPDGRLHVAFLDIGQGDAILITTPSGRQILIDGGPSPTQLGIRLSQEMPFWDRHLDMIVNTHPDMDHLAGLVPLLQRYQTEMVLVSPAEGTSSLYHAWRAQLEQTGQVPHPVSAGTALQLGDGLVAHILHPNPGSLYPDKPNNNSITLKLTFGQISFLFPGDIEMDAERRLARGDMADQLKATVLKSPHHGSKTSSSMAFLEQVNPQFVVISSGEDNRFGHPHEVVLNRYAAFGIQVFRTDEIGTVEFITDGERLWLETTR